MTQLSERWQDIMAGHARAALRGSKDASTRVGAVIYRPDRHIASTGFNGLPRGIPDDPVKLAIREYKYPRMVHAEANAIDHCYENMNGYGMVVTAHPCSACALRIASVGIATVYYLDSGLNKEERWKEDMELAGHILRNAGVILRKLPPNMGADEGA